MPKCHHPYDASLPEGYVAKLEEMDRRLAAGWLQKQCPGCRLWKVWIPPAKAKQLYRTIQPRRGPYRPRLGRRQGGRRAKA